MKPYNCESKEELEKLIERYNKDSINFISVEAVKIFKESDDEIIKLRALELLNDVG